MIKQTYNTLLQIFSILSPKIGISQEKFEIRNINQCFF